MKKWLLIIAAALTAAGLLLMGGAFAAAGMDFTRFDTNKYEDKEYSVTEEFQNIDIQADEADVTLEYAEPRSIRTATAEVFCTEREKTSYNVRVENGTLRINTDDKRKWFDYIGMFTKSLSVKIVLPMQEYGTLTVSGQTGDVTVPGDFSFESTEIKVSTGDVTYSGSVQDALKIKTDTGSIRLNDVAAGPIDLIVSTGKITADKITAEENISIKVSTGRTVLTDLTCRNLVSSGDTGKLTMKNVIAAEDISVERSTGDVSFDRCDAENITVKTSTGDVTGTLLSEKIFFTKTSTGSVNVPQSMSGGKCDIKTSTGDIDIRIAGS